MIAYDLEFGPNTDAAHKKIIYGLFAARQLLSLYRIARRQHGTPDLALVLPPNMDPSNVFAGPRADMSAHLQQKFKFPAPLMSAQRAMQLPHDHDAFWLIIFLPNCDIPVMVTMYPLQYEQAAEGEQLIGQA